ncbi:hypothetical protein MRX96_009689 [Rhipicephalus microplus]
MWNSPVQSFFAPLSQTLANQTAPEKSVNVAFDFTCTSAPPQRGDAVPNERGSGRYTLSSCAARVRNERTACGRPVMRERGCVRRACTRGRCRAREIVREALKRSCGKNGTAAAFDRGRRCGRRPRVSPKPTQLREHPNELYRG